MTTNPLTAILRETAQCLQRQWLTVGTLPLPAACHETCCTGSTCSTYTPPTSLTYPDPTTPCPPLYISVYILTLPLQK